ncbi:MAG: ribonuclease HII, partial [Verrucomicrobiae bacterium]|nr:ribonuclease HII [Verrucomicrobiae bacterium]
MPDRFLHERRLLHAGSRRLAGVDEAGRGALAGPVVAAAVILPAHWAFAGIPHHLRGVNDSKQLSPARREHFFELLTHSPDITFAVALIEAEIVDQINILNATSLAMQRAVQHLHPPPDHLLVDGHPVPPVSYTHL